MHNETEQAGELYQEPSTTEEPMNEQAMATPVAPKYVMGIDGGGTKTACVIMDEKEYIWAQVRSGSSNRHSVGDEQALANLEEVIQNALRVAGRSNMDIAAICLGMAGVDRPPERALITSWIEPLLPNATISIYNDALIALASGTGGTLLGVAVISGTGMLVYGINQAGQTQRAGGWGPLFGDCGSGYAIGAAALNAVAQATDGIGPKTAIDGALRDYLDLSTPQALIPWAYENYSWARIAELAPVVVECAQQQDEVAGRIIAEQAIDLAAAVEFVVRGLDMLHEPTAIVLSGGTLHPGLFSNLVQQHIHSLVPNAQLIRPNVEPVIGATLLALKSLRAEG
ncbi:MAG: hypothetical protein KDE19_14720 [Caldilineaceae bacterium]|nr:hypothetical protein [Caldilineaceae bacterium]